MKGRQLTRGPVSWEVRRSAHLEEYGMELAAIRDDIQMLRNQLLLKLDHYDYILSKAVEMIETPPPTTPAAARPVQLRAA